MLQVQRQLYEAETFSFHGLHTDCATKICILLTRKHQIPPRTVHIVNFQSRKSHTLAFFFSLMSVFIKYFAPNVRNLLEKEELGPCLFLH